jgi:branched-chain amino acid transport system permease protein
VVIFVIMVIVLLLRPAGCSASRLERERRMKPVIAAAGKTPTWHLLLGVALVGAIAPFVVYPTFLMKILCFALFACAFNLLLGFAGLLSFGHAAFFGGSAYVTALAVREVGATPELGHPRGAGFGALLGLRCSAAGHPARRHLLLDDHAGLAQLVFFLALQMKFTGGEDGLQGVPRGNCSASST